MSVGGNVGERAPPHMVGMASQPTLFHDLPEAEPAETSPAPLGFV
jgi:hypothetical protein